jgi:hypothetical protein
LLHLALIAPEMREVMEARANDRRFAASPFLSKDDLLVVVPPGDRCVL